MRPTPPELLLGLAPFIMPPGLLLGLAPFIMPPPGLFEPPPEVFEFSQPASAAVTSALRQTTKTTMSVCRRMTPPFG